jgi:hypothetical protein
MAKPRQASSGPVVKARDALANPARRAGAPRVDISESFRSARSGLGQISADFDRLRRHAASLVKGAHRTAK